MIVHPFYGFLIFYAIEIGYLILCFPGLWLCLFSGMIFTKGVGVSLGLFLGTLVTALSQITVALITFPIFKFILNDWIRNLLKEDSTIQKMELAIEKNNFTGIKISWLSRLNIIFPSFILNNCFPASKMAFSQYSLGFFGIIIPEFLFNFFGSCFYHLLDESKDNSYFQVLDLNIFQWIFIILGIVFCIFLTFWSFFEIRKEINKYKELIPSSTIRLESINSQDQKISHIVEIQDSLPSEIKVIPKIVF